MPDAIIFDTEFTSWEGAMARKWSGPNEYRELVQIGAVRIDANSLEVLETFEILTKPVRNPQLSAYFIGLTGIRQDQLDANGLDFETGLAQFMQFIGGLPPWSYGGDVSVLAENMQLNGMPVPADWPTIEATNLVPWFHKHAPQTKGINSGRLASTLGVPLKITEHTGLGDSLSILAAIKELMRQGASSPFTVGQGAGG